MNNAEYHAHPAISKSKLDSIARSPLHYWHRYINPDAQPPEPTPAMEFGTAVHSIILEPDLFNSEYALAPSINRTTKAGKEAWAEASTSGKKLVAADTLESLLAIRESIFSHPIAKKALEAPGVAESSIFAIDPETGLELKCRPDYLTEGNWIVDLKTTTDASLAEFQRSVSKYRYHVQSAHYKKVVELDRGIPILGFIFIVVEKTAPYAVQVFQASSSLILAGSNEATRNLADLAHALMQYPPGKPWPTYTESLIQLDPPAWMAKN